MNDFVNFMDAALGRSKPELYRGIIWIDRYGVWKLLDGDSLLFDEDLFQECDFKDNLTDTKDLPNYSGLYRMEIRIHSYQCNNFDDPTEWDMDISITNWWILDKSWSDKFEK
jgi:hypothetical protein